MCAAAREKAHVSEPRDFGSKACFARRRIELHQSKEGPAPVTPGRCRTYPDFHISVSGISPENFRNEEFLVLTR